MTAEELRERLKFLAADHGLKLTSEHRPGARTRSGRVSDHAHNRALDFAGSPAQMAAYADAVEKQYGSRVKELIYSPKGHYERGRWSKGDKHHHNHVHVAWHGDTPDPVIDPKDIEDARRFARQQPVALDPKDIEDARRFAKSGQKKGPVPSNALEAANWAKQKAPRPPRAATSTPPSKLPLADIKGYPAPRKAKFGSFREQEEAAAEFRSSYYDAPRPAGIPEPLTQKMTPRQFAEVRGGVQKAINFASSPLFPVREIINRMAEENAKFKAKHPNWRDYKGKQLEDYNRGRQQSILRGLEKSQPWQAFVSGLKGQDVPFEPFQLAAKHNPEFRRSLKVFGINISPAALDFAASIPIDALTGQAQGRVVGSLAAKAGKPLLAAAEKKLPALGREMGIRRAYQATREEQSLQQAVAERHVRAAAEVAENLRRKTKANRKAGATVRVKDPLTRAPINKFAEKVADYVELGTKGSPHAVPRPPTPAVAAMNLGPKAAAAVRGGVDEAGAFTERVLQSARTAGRERVEELTARGSITTPPPAKTPALPPKQRKELLALIRQQAETKGRERLRELIADGEGQAALEQVLDSAATAGRDELKRLLAKGALEQAVESAKTAGVQRVDDLTLGVAPTERQVPIWAEREAMEARRAEELPRLQADVESLGINWDDVVEVGEQYRALGDEIGQEMVDLGIISPDAYETLRGSYLPRLYMLTSSSPKEAKKWLDGLESQGLIPQAAAAHIRGRLLTRAKGFSSGEDFTRHREITEFSERISPEVGRIASREATPAFARYAQSAAREIGEARAWKNLADNRPDLVLSEEAVKAGTAVPEGWTFSADLNLYLHPGVARYIEVREILRQRANWGPAWWRDLNKSMRRWWISAPRTAVNNGAGNYVLGKVEASKDGTRYTPAGYAQAWLREYRPHRQSQGKEYNHWLLEECDTRTDLLSEGSGIMPAETRRLGAGFGVETFAERELQALKDIPRFQSPMLEAYSQNVYRDVEAAGRYYLYKEIRLNQIRKNPAARYDEGAIDEAARRVRRAMIDYSDIGPDLALADRMNIFPFLTFPVKAIWNYLGMAVRRPDQVQTFTGERLRDLADAMADELDPEAGAKEKRRKGLVSPMEIPLPGFADDAGQQRYFRAPIASPVLQMFPANPDADIVTERFKGMAPVARQVYEQAFNKNLSIDKPLVPPGLPPDGLLGEAFRRRALHFGKAFIPEVVDADNLYHALTGTTAYASPFAPRPQWDEVMLRFITGIAPREGAGSTSLQGLERAGERMLDPEHEPYQEYAMEVVRDIDSGKIPVPEGYAAFLKQYKTTNRHKLASLMNEGGRRIGLLQTTREYSDEHRRRAIRDQLLFNRAMYDRLLELEEEEPVTPDATASAIP